MASLSPAPSALSDTPDETIRRLSAELHETQEQQAAATEILKIINSSGSDLAPVFDAILEKAHRLCGAELGTLFTYDGERFWPVAAPGATAEFEEFFREGLRPGPGNPFASVIEGEPLVHIADIRQLAAVYPDDPGLRVAVDIGLMRTFLVVPLRKDDVLLGVISAIRREVRPFSDKQIALLENFAAQAVIAMENARLINETREALEQQTATADVLQVINSSPSNPGPRLDAILEKATALCDAAYGLMSTYHGGQYSTVASRGVGPELAEFMRAPPHPDSESALGRIARGEDLVL